MKRFLLLLGVMLPCMSCMGTRGEAAGKTGISATISECRQYEGVEFIKLGRLATGAIKGVVGTFAIGDSDVREAVRLIKDIHGLTVLQYEDCAEEDRDSINLKLTSAFADSEMLMEVNDSGDKVKIYGSYDERSGRVRDFILFVPSESALICIQGSVSMDTIARIASND